MEPAPLLDGLGEHLTQRRPEPQRPVADGEHRGAHAAPLGRAEQVQPGLGGLAVPVLEGDQLLGAIGADADHDQQAHLVLAEADLEVDPVDPHVHVVDVTQAAVAERGGFVLPLGGQPGDRRRRQAGGRHHHHHDEDHDEHEHHDHDHDEDGLDHSHCDHEHGHCCHHDHDHEDGEEEYGIGSFVYHRIRPFNQDKLQQFVENWPKSVVRAKGVLWFDDKREDVYVFEQAGVQITATEQGKWLAAFPKKQQKLYLAEYPDMAEKWDEKYGDREIKLVFIGQHMDRHAIVDALDECLSD